MIQYPSILERSYMRNLHILHNFSTQNIKERRVTPDVQPGYLRKLLPEEAPESGEKWESIMEDVETKIMPGVS